MVNNSRLDVAGRLFAMCGIGLLFNFLMHLFMKPSLPFAVGQPGFGWLPLYATASLISVWGGAVSGCLLLMRPDRERWYIARALRIIHACLLLFLLAGLWLGQQWLERAVQRVYPDEAVQMYELATILTALVVGLALVTFVDAGKVLWRIADREIPVT